MDVLEECVAMAEETLDATTPESLVSCLKALTPLLPKVFPLQFLQEKLIVLSYVYVSSDVMYACVSSPLLLLLDSDYKFALSLSVLASNIMINLV